MIDERIKFTLQWFAICEIAPTSFETWRYLLAKGENHAACSLYEVAKELDRMLAGGMATQTHGFWQLPEHASLCLKRWLGFQHGAGRMRQVRRWAAKLAWLPFVRSVSVAGSQALGQEKPTSDIDLFVEVEPGWLWTARTFVTAWFQILGLRRHGTKIANRFCLNHYVAGPKKLVPGSVYAAFEYAKLLPVVGAGEVWQFQHNNPWIQKFFPNSLLAGSAEQPARLFQRVVEWGFRNFGGRFLEQLLDRWQSSRIRTSEEVLVEKDELSFHPESKEQRLVARFSQLE